MCIPESLNAASVEDVADRLHAFLCGYHHQWIKGDSGSCKLRRNCAEWSDGKEEVEDIEKRDSIKEREGRKKWEGGKKETVGKGPDSIKEKETASGRKAPSILNVTLTIAEPLVCVCSTPSLNDIKKAAEIVGDELKDNLKHERYFEKQAEELKTLDTAGLPLDSSNKVVADFPAKTAGDRVKASSKVVNEVKAGLQLDERSIKHAQRDSDSNNVIIMKPSINGILSRCHEEDPAQDVCVKVEGKLPLPVSQLVTSTSSYSSSPLGRARVSIATKIHIRICGIPKNVTAEDRKFRIAVVCEKYASDGVTCDEVPCIDAWCRREDKIGRSRGGDNANADAGKGGEGKAVQEKINFFTAFFTVIIVCVGWHIQWCQLW